MYSLLRNARLVLNNVRELHGEDREYRNTKSNRTTYVEAFLRYLVWNLAPFDVESHYLRDNDQMLYNFGQLMNIPNNNPKDELVNLFVALIF